jgi:hypothetical protein
MGLALFIWIASTVILIDRNRAEDHARAVCYFWGLLFVVAMSYRIASKRWLEFAPADLK